MPWLVRCRSVATLLPVSRRRYKFLDNRGRARLAIVCLSIMGLLNLVSLGYLLFCYLNEGDPILQRLGGFEQGFHWVNLGMLVLTAIAFLRWIRRAYENAGATGLRMENEPGYAVWCWFVPILNLWGPFVIVGAVHHHAMREQARWVPRLWWATYLGSGIVARVSQVMMEGVKTMSDWHVALSWGALGDAMAVISAVLAVVVVRATTVHTGKLSTEVADVFGDAAAKSPQSTTSTNAANDVS